VAYSRVDGAPLLMAGGAKMTAQSPLYRRYEEEETRCHHRRQKSNGDRDQEQQDRGAVHAVERAVDGLRPRLSRGRASTHLVFYLVLTLSE
jgi:hypothetical protein